MFGRLFVVLIMEERGESGDVCVSENFEVNLLIDAWIVRGFGWG